MLTLIGLGGQLFEVDDDVDVSGRREGDWQRVQFSFKFRPATAQAAQQLKQGSN